MTRAKKKAPRARNGDLRVSKTLTLPIESVVETFAILGKRGSGKTASAVVMAEEMIAAGQPTVIVDPVGVWWGLRSNAAGTGEGLPVVIFGGDHADVPLSEAAGVVVADAIIEGRFPAILDLSHLSKSAMRRLMADFLERLYQRNREPLHLIVDEADLMAPQRVPADSLRLLGAMDDIQRRGRARGIGTTLITQRPAVLNKDLLSQAEVLVAMRLTGVRDVAAIDEWVRLNADEAEAATVKASLASLPVGTAWVWSPSLLGILEKVAIRPRETFDSSATPKPGAKVRVATAFASVDKEALGAQVAALAEEAEANDPRKIRARLARAEKELAAARTKAETAAVSPKSAAPKEVRVEVPVVDTEALSRIEDAVRRAAEAEAALSDLLREHLASAQETRDALASLVESARDAVTAAPVPTRPERRTRPTGPPERARRIAAPAQPRPSAPARPASNGESDTALPKAERLILGVLATHGPLTIAQVAILTSYSSKGGGFRNALSSLRSAGRITGTGTIEITEQGLDDLGDYEALPTGQDLLDWWKQHPKIGKAESMVLDVLAAEWPEPVTIEEIAERTDYSAAGGGFRNALSRLRTLELASGRGEMRLADIFFDQPTR